MDPSNGGRKPHSFAKAALLGTVIGAVLIGTYGWRVYWGPRRLARSDAARFRQAYDEDRARRDSAMARILRSDPEQWLPDALKTPETWHDLVWAMNQTAEIPPTRPPFSPGLRDALWSLLKSSDTEAHVLVGAVLRLYDAPEEIVAARSKELRGAGAYQNVRASLQVRRDWVKWPQYPARHLRPWQGDQNYRPDGPDAMPNLLPRDADIEVYDGGSHLVFQYDHNEEPNEPCSAGLTLKLADGAETKPAWEVAPAGEDFVLKDLKTGRTLYSGVFQSTFIDEGEGNGLLYFEQLDVPLGVWPAKVVWLWAECGKRRLPEKGRYRLEVARLR